MNLFFLNYIIPSSTIIFLIFHDDNRNVFTSITIVYNNDNILNFNLLQNSDNINNKLTILLIAI